MVRGWRAGCVTQVTFQARLGIYVNRRIPVLYLASYIPLHTPATCSGGPNRQGERDVHGRSTR
ncbi:hypothetical protein BGLA2_260047 [Burkholderia gladioli]|nr:hypothetical protein BGLA2_260047 [Burkholderia gladioli]